ncbi:MAG: 50S ribosomal protein L3, partial [Rubrobacteridae bacterium]|nr:50S ribosomal protein L3 [Rubrobacteridae bacterium]
LGMTQIFVGDKLIPVTVVEAGPCVITQVKTEKTDGYSAIQIGYGDIEERKVTKPRMGHFSKAKIAPKRHLAEVRLEDTADHKPGDTFTADVFEVGDRVDAVGVSKGKGFQGVMKRHGFGGGPGGHGSHFHRAPGSIGAAAFPARVVKGRRMAGHMGCDRVTSINLEIVKVDPEQSILLLKGAVPGGKGSLLMIKQSSRVKKKG